MADNFKCSLELKGKSGELSVKCGSISHISMQIFSYGFRGSVAFVVDKKDKLDFFYEHAIIEVTLKIESSFAEEGAKPIEFQGIVTTKLLQESREGFAPDKIEKRTCEIEFYDPAAAIWSQHFPVRIFTEKSMEDVINSYISKSISVKYESESIKKTKPLIALGLGDRRNSVPFYTFLMWHLREEGKIWDYDYENKQYVIRDEKDSSKEAVDLPYDAGRVSVIWPLRPRQDIRIVNSYTEEPATNPVKGIEPYEGINRDILLTTALASEVESYSQEAKLKPKTFEHQLKIQFLEYPKVTFLPGNLYTFTKPQWGKELYFKKNSYRLHTLQLVMNGLNNPLTDSPGDEQKYQLNLVGLFETKEELYAQRPSIQTPLYPFPLEGKIFSEVGAKKELTFDIGKDEKTDQFYYTIEIPWAENQKVKAPFEPTYTNGQIYNPLLKGQRVVVEFHLFSAKIVEVKDWLGPTKMPHKTQGNRIVFAPRNENITYTILEHKKEDDSTLTLLIERKSAEQIQRLCLKEDGLHITVHQAEKDDPQCHLWMDNEHTITITSQDKEKQMTQNITLKPEMISTLCEKGGDKSTIVQTPKSISIDCQEFNLKTKTSSFTSEEVTAHKAKKLNIEGDQGTTINDGSKVSISAASVTVG